MTGEQGQGCGVWQGCHEFGPNNHDIREMNGEAKLGTHRTRGGCCEGDGERQVWKCLGGWWCDWSMRRRIRHHICDNAAGWVRQDRTVAVMID